MDEFLALAYHEEYDLRDRDRAPVQHRRARARRGRTAWSFRASSNARSLATEIEIYGDGDQTRCFCHVQDTIRALRDLMTDIDRTAGEIFNVGASNQISILALAEQDQGR